MALILLVAAVIAVCITFLPPKSYGKGKKGDHGQTSQKHNVIWKSDSHVHTYQNPHGWYVIPPDPSVWSTTFNTAREHRGRDQRHENTLSRCANRISTIAEGQPSLSSKFVLFGCLQVMQKYISFDDIRGPLPTSSAETSAVLHSHLDLIKRRVPRGMNATPITKCAKPTGIPPLDYDDTCHRQSWAWNWTQTRRCISDYCQDYKRGLPKRCPKDSHRIHLGTKATSHSHPPHGCWWCRTNITEYVYHKNAIEAHCVNMSERI